MKVLFVMLGEIGHVNPFMGVCQRLSREGADIAIHCGRDFTDQFAKAGVRVQKFTALQDRETPQPPAALMAKRMRDPRWLERWYQMAVESLPRVVESVDAAARDFAPDVICVDHSNMAGAIVALKRQDPWITVTTNFMPLRPPSWGCPFVDVGARLLPSGLAPYGLKLEDVDLSPWFGAIFTTETFVPRDQASNPDWHFVGPPRLDAARGDEVAFPWERLDGRPLVYISSGGGQSLGFDAACVNRLASSLRSEEAQIVISAQKLFEDESFRTALPDNCIAVRYAPQLALLDRAATAVTHGGVNSFNECLDRGCPMLVLPLGKEQPLQAELAQRSGVGLTLDPLQFTVEESREALLTLIADGPHRRRAREVRDSYRATDSTAALSAALTKVARKEKPAAPR